MVSCRSGRINGRIDYEGDADVESEEESVAGIEFCQGDHDCEDVGDSEREEDVGILDDAAIARGHAWRWDQASGV